MSEAVLGSGKDFVFWSQAYWVWIQADHTLAA